MEGGGLSMAPVWIRTCLYLWIKDNFCKELRYPPIAVEQCLKKYTVKHCWLTYFHGIILTDYSAGMRMDVLDNIANHKKHDLKKTIKMISENLSFFKHLILKNDKQNKTHFYINIYINNKLLLTNLMKTISNCLKRFSQV